jgi:FMN-dependent NADH-azoreductase
MTTILQINASLFGEHGQSRQLGDVFVQQWREREPDTKVIHRDLARFPVPHLTLDRFKAGLTPAEERDPEQAEKAALADTLIAELQTADILVIGLPVYNFNIPSTLKTWIDHVARAGATFRYTEAGPVGLLKGKRAFVFVASGGQYEGTPLDFQTPYIRHVLGFLGIDDVTFTHAEGLALGEAARRQALEGANGRIQQLAA